MTGSESRWAGSAIVRLDPQEFLLDESKSGKLLAMPGGGDGNAVDGSLSGQQAGAGGSKCQRGLPRGIVAVAQPGDTGLGIEREVESVLHAVAKSEVQTLRRFDSHGQPMIGSGGDTIFLLQLRGEERLRSCGWNREGVCDPEAGERRLLHVSGVRQPFCVLFVRGGAAHQA